MRLIRLVAAIAFLPCWAAGGRAQHATGALDLGLVQLDASPGVLVLVLLPWACCWAPLVAGGVTTAAAVTEPIDGAAPARQEAWVEALDQWWMLVLTLPLAALAGLDHRPGAAANATATARSASCRRPISAA